MTDALWEGKTKLWSFNTATSRFWLLFHYWKRVYFASLAGLACTRAGACTRTHTHMWMQCLTFGTYVR